jgi:hypothetical protein
MQRGMRAMDEGPYIPTFVPCGQMKIESVQFVRLRAAISDCRLKPVASDDIVNAIAAQIDRAAGRLYTRTQLESVERARGEDKRTREARLYAMGLAKLLSKRDDPVVASMERYFDLPVWSLPRIRELNPVTLEPKSEWTPQDRDDDDDMRALERRTASSVELWSVLGELGRWAELYGRRPKAALPVMPKKNGRRPRVLTVMPKKNGHSPMRRFIRDLAPQFEALFDKRAYVERIN